MDKCDVDRLLKSNSPRIQLISCSQAKSTVWKDFKRIQRDGQDTPFAACVYCRAVVTCKNETGTGSLKRHNCKNVGPVSFNVASGQAELVTIVARDIVPAPLLQEVAFKAARFVCRDIRPPDVVGGDGFKEFCQSLIDLGVRCGSIPAEDVLPIISSMCCVQLEKMHIEVKEQLRMKLREQSSLSFAIDLWRDDYRKICYISVTVHFINDKFEYKTNSLSTIPCSWESTTAIGIRDTVQESLEEFFDENADHVLEQAMFVTDDTDDVQAAFDGEQRVGCSCHHLNAVIEDVLDREIHEMPDIEELVLECIDLVASFRKDGLNAALSNNLKQTCALKWDSKLTLLQSVLSVYPQLEAVLVEQMSIPRLTRIDRPLLEAVIVLLQPFRECSEALSSDSSPTINEVALWKKKLEVHCQRCVADSPSMAELRERMLLSLSDKFKVESIHLVAAFLDPRFKNLRMFNKEEVDTAHQVTRKWLESLESPKTASEDVNGDSEPAAKVRRISQHPLLMFADYLGSDQGEKRDEFAEYLSIPSLPVSADILGFWKNCTSLPRMQKLARNILAIPASAAISERCFSVSSHKVNERRAMLPPERVNTILFLNKNI